MSEDKKGYIGIGIIITVGIIIVIFLFQIIASDEEKHIERVSQRCAEQGYGITARYTKQGDKYYVCKVGDSNGK